jgi:hypothetical protein
MWTDVSEVRTVTIIRVMSAASIIALMMEAAHTSETLVDICLTTRQNIPEDSELLSIHVVQERQGTAESR